MAVYITLHSPSPLPLPQTVKQMWLFICQFVDKLVRETIEPAVKSANPHLSSFCFTKIDMGDKVMRKHTEQTLDPNARDGGIWIRDICSV